MVGAEDMIALQKLDVLRTPELKFTEGSCTTISSGVKEELMQSLSVDH